MPSNVAEWSAQMSFGQSPPQIVQDTLQVISDVLETIDRVLEYIEEVLKVIQAFLGGGTDLIINWIKTWAAPILGPIQDLLSFGGGFIVITPFNRINKKKANMGTTMFPFNIPSMTPQEAFNEFYASFDNSEDLLRPRWTDNTKVTGWGLLVTAPDMMDVTQIVNALTQLINVEGFTSLGESIIKDATEWLEDTKKQAGEAFSLESLITTVNFDISSIVSKKYLETNYRSTGVKITGNNNNPISIKTTSVVEETTLPSLHWWAVDLSMFPGMKMIMEGIQFLINTLLKALGIVDNIVSKTIELLLRKVQELRNLVVAVANLCRTFLISLSQSGLYTFNIPPDYGGVNYIKSALQTSLSSPTTVGAKTVSSLLKSNDLNFSVLFFMGATVGINTDAWSDLWTSALALSEDQLDAFNAQFAPKNFAVIPSFDKTVVNFGDKVTLQVISKSDVTMYYTYRITSEIEKIVSEYMYDNTNIAGQVVNHRAAVVNETTFLIDFATNFSALNIVEGKPTKYGTKKYEFDLLVYTTGSANVQEYHKEFYVSDSLLKYNTTLTDSTPISIETSWTVAPGSTVQVLRNQLTTELFYIKGGIVYLGSTLFPGEEHAILQYTDEFGNVVTFNIENNKGITIGEISTCPFPKSLKFLSFPAKISIPYKGAMRYRIKGSTSEDDWIYITLPANFSIADETRYEYDIFISADEEMYLGVEKGKWLGTYDFSIVKRATSGTRICG